MLCKYLDFNVKIDRIVCGRPSLNFKTFKQFLIVAELLFEKYEYPKIHIQVQCMLLRIQIQQSVAADTLMSDIMCK